MKNYQKRAITIINNTINELNLKLTDLNVLTEVGSNNYLFTPIIPALANANKVFAWVNNSKYGNGAEIIENCMKVLNELGLNNVEFSLNERNPNHIIEADIITNSGFVRPLDRNLLSFVIKRNVAIPIMFEAWELRKSDIDIEYCRELGINIGGTDENHFSINVFSFIQELSLKMVFESGLEVKDNFILVWSNDQFGVMAEEAFKRNGAKVLRSNKIDDFILNIQFLDLVFICDYYESRDYFGKSKDSIFHENIISLFNGKFIHLYGKVNIGYCKSMDLDIWPQIDGYERTMTKTLDYLGSIPTLRLLTAGFKVGELLIKKEFNHPLLQII